MILRVELWEGFRRRWPLSWALCAISVGRDKLDVGTYRSIVCRLWQEEKGEGVAKGVNNVLD